MSAINWRTRRAVVLLALACLGLFALHAALVNPLHEFPMGDDWEYAHTVERLLATGQFYRSPLVQATAFFPALWGALFSRLLGFSFITLRLSTLPLAAGAIGAFYMILGELGFSPARRLLGTLTFMLAPLFVFYAHSFMTDVPFLFWLLLGLWSTQRGLRVGRPGWLWFGSLCAALAFLTRQLGLALPAAAALGVLAYRPRSQWPAWLAASVALPVAACALFYGWQALAHQASWADTAITGQGTLQYILNPQLPAAAARRVVVMLVTINLYLLPLWLAFAPAAPMAWRGLRGPSPRKWLAGVLLASFLFGSILYFGARGQWWPYFEESFTRAGLWPSLAFFAYPADRRPPFLPAPVWIGLTFVGAVLALILVLNLALRLARAVRPAAGLSLSRARDWANALGSARSVFYFTFLALLALLLVFPLFFERYFLPFLPAGIVLLLEATRRARPAPWLAGAALLASALLSVGLMWDYFSWHEVRWARSQALVARGTPLEKLDAGYEWSGWHLADRSYVYLEAHGIPVVNSPWQYVIDPQFMVTFSLVPGYHVVEVWPFYSPFRVGGADHLLLLERGPAPPAMPVP